MNSVADRFDATDYIDVAARIHDFYAKYPDGRLVTRSWQVVHAGNKDFVAAEAEAYRTVDDPHPGVGIAWEPIPGPTPFTKDSELQNAETSAWGRAIVSLGFETKHIASRQEVENRQYPDRATRGPNRNRPANDAPPPGNDEPPPVPGNASAVAAKVQIEAAMREHRTTLAGVERVLGHNAVNAEDARAWWTASATEAIAAFASLADVDAIATVQDIVRLSRADAPAPEPAGAQP